MTSRAETSAGSPSARRRSRRSESCSQLPERQPRRRRGWSAALVAKGALNGVHFHTDDLDSSFENVRDAGAEIVQVADRAAMGHAGLRAP